LEDILKKSRLADGFRCVEEKTLGLIELSFCKKLVSGEGAGTHRDPLLKEATDFRAPAMELPRKDLGLRDETKEQKDRGREWSLGKEKCLHMSLTTTPDMKGSM
jgi:hypothetical protein